MYPVIGAYVRISDDTEGSGAGVGRQEVDCLKLADLRGWKVYRVYVDNDLSAFKPHVVRPEFEQLLLDLDADVIDGIVTYDLDRFVRQPADLERAIRIYDSRPGLTFATVQGDLDLASADGRTMARVMVAFANKSSMDTSRRVTRKHLELAMQGSPVGGYRPFGFEKDKRTVNQFEATLIRKAAQDVLSGIGLHTIARQWGKLGVKTGADKPVMQGRLKHILLSPRTAGFRVYHGKLARDTDGNPIKGQYDAILDLETWEAVCAVLQDPKRTGKHVHIGGRKYLLSGIIRCALCSGYLRGNAAARTPRFFSYACKAPTNGGCGRVAVSGHQVDRIVTDLVLRYLSEKHVERKAEPWPGETELSDVTHRIAELMGAYTAGTLTGDVVFPSVSKLEGQARELRDARTVWLRQQVTVSISTDVPTEWPTLPIERQRSIIESVIQAVLVKPAANRGARFDPGRVEVVWK